MSAASRPVHEDLDTPVRRIAQVLARFEANRRGLLEWIDRSWLPGWAVRLESGSCPDDGSAALARLLGLGVPDLELCRPGDAALGVLATLAVEQVLTMLRVRSVWFRRNELRRFVGRESREHCVRLLGTARAADLLRHIQAAPAGPQIEPLRRAGMLSLQTLTAPLLAWEGWCLFRRDGALPFDGPVDLVRLALPRELAEPKWLAACDRAIDGDGSIEALRLLPHLHLERS